MVLAAEVFHIGDADADRDRIYGLRSATEQSDNFYLVISGENSSRIEDASGNAVAAIRGPHQEAYDGARIVHTFDDTRATVLSDNLPNKN